MDLPRDLIELFSAFESAKVRYLLVGGHAVAAHGRPRSTKDVDLWLAPEKTNLARACRALTSFGAPAEIVEALRTSKPDEIVWMGRAPTRIDLLRTLPGVVFDDAWPSRIVLSIQGARVPVIGKPTSFEIRRSSDGPRTGATCAPFPESARTGGRSHPGVEGNEAMDGHQRLANVSATMARLWTRRLSALLLLGTVACGGDVGTPPPAAPCEEKCQDQVALRAVREMTKLAYNLLLQGKPVGDQDQRSPCPLGGSVQVFGNATSNAAQGATEVDLTYEFSACGHMELDEEPEETYRMTLDGTLTQVGTLAAQPSATTALIMRSDGMSLAGTVHDPPITYDALDCVLELGQDGNDLSGMFCGKPVGVDLGGQN